MGFRHSIKAYLIAPPFGIRPKRLKQDMQDHLMLDAQLNRKYKMKRLRKCLAETCYRGRRPPEAEIKGSVILVLTAFLAEKRLVPCRPVFLQNGR